MALEIVPARPEQSSVLTALAFAAKRSWNYPEDWIRSWEHALTITPGFIAQYPTYAALRDGQILGFHAVLPAFDHFTLEHLWVSPEHSRQGIGTALFQHAAERARNAGAPSLAIESDPNALPFYIKQGAVAVGHRLSCVCGVIRCLPLLRASTELRQLEYSAPSA